jgi:hypothetical protein
MQKKDYSPERTKKNHKERHLGSLESGRNSNRTHPWHKNKPTSLLLIYTQSSSMIKKVQIRMFLEINL